jgi:hypothetical protein
MERLCHRSSNPRAFQRWLELQWIVLIDKDKNGSVPRQPVKWLAEKVRKDKMINQNGNASGVVAG